MDQPTFLNPAAVAKRIGLSRSTIYKLMACDASFPPAIRLLPKSPRWRVEDIDRWVETKTASAA